MFKKWVWGILPLVLGLSIGAGTAHAQNPVSIAQVGTLPVTTTIPVSATTMPLPTGAATSGLQTTGNTSLATIATATTDIDNKMPFPGQTTMSGSLPVTMAADQNPIPVTGATNTNTGSMPTVGTTLAVSTLGMATVTGQYVSGATIQNYLMEGQVDGSSLWVPLYTNSYPYIATSPQVNLASRTYADTFSVSVSGYKFFRLRNITGVTTEVWTIEATPAPTVAAIQPTTIVDPTVGGSSGRVGVSGSALHTLLVNPANGASVDVMSSTPTGAETGLIVRNIPSGTQTVSGSVTASVSGTVTATQGNNNGSVGQSWNMKINDGVNGPATVKAASTLPALTDVALVTTQRDPLPAGTNVIGHTIIDSGSTTTVTGNVTVVQPAVTTSTTAAFTAAGTVIDVSVPAGTSYARITWLGTAGTGIPILTVQSSSDGSTFASFPVTRQTATPNTTSNTSITVNADGAAASVFYHAAVVGVQTLRFTSAGSWTGGNSVQVYLEFSQQQNTFGWTAARQDGTWSDRITDGTNTSAVKAASTTAVAADPALVVTLSPNSSGQADTTTNGAITSTTCATGVVSQTGCVIIPMLGQQSVSVSWPAGGTGIMTVVVEFTNDSTGTTWTGSYFDVPNGAKSASQTLANANTAFVATIVGMGGSRYARVRATAFTSGTTTFTLTASSVNDPTVLYSGPDGSATAPPMVAAVAGAVTTAAPAYTTGQQKQISLDTGGHTRVKNAQDEGRTALSFYANNVASGTTGTETLFTLTLSSGTGATSTPTSYTITNGKRFRITALSVASRGNATATIQSTVFNLRMNTGGACVVTSTPILFAAQSATPATASAWDRVIIPIPDGYEIAGNGTISICLSAAATFVTNAPTWSVNLIGFEY